MLVEQDIQLGKRIDWVGRANQARRIRQANRAKWNVKSDESNTCCFVGSSQSKDVIKLIRWVGFVMSDQVIWMCGWVRWTNRVGKVDTTKMVKRSNQVEEAWW